MSAPKGEEKVLLDHDNGNDDKTNSSKKLEIKDAIEKTEEKHTEEKKVASKDEEVVDYEEEEEVKVEVPPSETSITEKLEKTSINKGPAAAVISKSWADEDFDDEPEPVIEIKEVSGLIESVHNVEVKLADQQANESSPLYSVHSFEELGL